MLTSTAVDYGFKPYLGQIKHHKSNICCFSTRYIALRSKSKDWHGQCHDNYRLIHGLFHIAPEANNMPQNMLLLHMQIRRYLNKISDNVFSWRDMPTCALLLL